MSKNIIYQTPHEALGYNFVPAAFLPSGKNEYYLRELQNRNGITYRGLTAYEIERLVNNGNTSDNWNNLLVSDAFNPDLVKNCAFFGLVRIGKLEPVCLGFSDLKMPVGLYHSTIISCDFGDNVVISHVNYMSHYIVGSESMLINIHELVTTNHAKFGNGIIKEGEDESVRIWMEICNENTGRKVMPFNGMLPGDAYLWSRYRDDNPLQKSFQRFTEERFNDKRGYYGKIGDRTIIKNCSIIKDVWIGSDAYIKGANKLKNLTINSDADRKSQIGEGCELVNGIVGFGCRIFYGVKAVRFITASHSQLKYGARLINSYLGNNSTISCCEVLNSMIFPAHEQHHNNSFLCASLVMGQSNIAAGVTIGSNHNSRGADGEIVAGRGFWPGLCVSLKHNSKFASFTILAKGDYPNELNIPIPFSLVSLDHKNDQLIAMPAYWFMYNMYALARNASKYIDRDKRTQKTQLIEYGYLAPDTVNEIFNALRLLENSIVNENGEAFINGWENSTRKTKLIKVPKAITVFKELINYYACNEMLAHISEQGFEDFETFKKSLKTAISRSSWLNTGGQLIQETAINRLKKNIKSGKIKSWDEVHSFYQQQGIAYKNDKLQHSYASLLELKQLTSKQFTPEVFNEMLSTYLYTDEWMTKGIYDARVKDYSNPFRKMVYDNDAEMLNVVGKIEDNSFIQEQFKKSTLLQKRVKAIQKKWKLN
jgi:hypothetical protein